MDYDELLRRLDAHMERGNEIMAESNALMAENRRAFEANTRAFEDLRTFLGDLTHALRLMTENFVAEMDAQRRALVQILDRLDGQGEGSTGA